MPFHGDYRLPGLAACVAHVGGGKADEMDLRETHAVVAPIIVSVSEMLIRNHESVGKDALHLSASGMSELGNGSCSPPKRSHNWSAVTTKLPTLLQSAQSALLPASTCALPRRHRSVTGDSSLSVLVPRLLHSRSREEATRRRARALHSVASDGQNRSIP